MIKAKAEMRDGRSIVILGLSRRNTELLLEGKPMHIDLREMGVDAEVLIVGGETEGAIAATLSEFMTEHTWVDDQRGKENP